MTKKDEKNTVKVNENTKKEEKNMEKVSENTVKVSENTEKKEKNMENSAIIDDRTPETKKRIREMNKKGGDTKKKPAKNTSKSTKNTKKGGKEMTYKDKLVEILRKTAKDNKDLEVNEVMDRSGNISTYQLRRGGDNLVSIRKSDILACQPRSFFAKTLMNKVPYFKKFEKGVEIYTHMVHIRPNIEEEIFTQVVKKAITSKKTVAEWKRDVISLFYRQP